MGYLPPFAEVPLQIRTYIGQHLNLSPDTRFQKPRISVLGFVNSFAPSGPSASCGSNSLYPTRPFLTEMANTKIQQFVAEAAALDVGDMRDIQHRSRRYSLLISLLYHAQVQTRDALAAMLLKRMRRTTTSAQKQLKELQDHHRELAEQMLAVFADVIDETIHTPDGFSVVMEQKRTLTRPVCWTPAW